MFAGCYTKIGYVFIVEIAVPTAAIMMLFKRLFLIGVNQIIGEGKAELISAILTFEAKHIFLL